MSECYSRQCANVNGRTKKSDQCVQCDWSFHVRQGAWYGEYGQAVRSSNALITSDGPGVRSGVWVWGAPDYRNELMFVPISF